MGEYASARKAPCSRAVRPRFTAVRPDYAEGALAEVSIPADKCWIPRRMQVAYTARAASDITCIAETDRFQWSGDDPDVPERVRGVRDDGTVVVVASSGSGRRRGAERRTPQNC